MLIFKIEVLCIALIFVGLILVVGGTLAFRAEKYFETELNTGKYSLNTVHELLHIQTETDLTGKTEKDLYKIALKYRVLSIMFNDQLVGFMKILILLGISLILLGSSTLTLLKKIKNAEPEAPLYGEQRPSIKAKLFAPKVS